MQAWPGRPYPLGATYDGVGTNFALFSEVAERVELCLFDRAGEERRVPLAEVDGHVWQAFLPGTGPGQRYGYRVYGPHDPVRGLRCNPAKLLLDPYANPMRRPWRGRSGGVPACTATRSGATTVSAMTRTARRGSLAPS